MKNLLSNTRIQSRNWIVKQVYIFICINCSCKTYSGLLTSAEINSFLSNFRQVATWQYLEVSLQFADFEDVHVFNLVQCRPKKNIISNCFILNPWNLLRISNVSANRYRSFNNYILVVEEKIILKLCKFFLIDHLFLLSFCFTILVQNLRTDVQQVTDDGIQQAAFPRSNVSDNADELSFLDFKINLFQSNQLPKCLFFIFCHHFLVIF